MISQALSRTSVANGWIMKSKKTPYKKSAANHCQENDMGEKEKAPSTNCAIIIRKKKQTSSLPSCPTWYWLEDTVSHHKIYDKKCHLQHSVQGL